jgi:hypothetical protein
VEPAPGAPALASALPAALPAEPVAVEEAGLAARGERAAEVAEPAPAARAGRLGAPAAMPEAAGQMTG